MIGSSESPTSTSIEIGDKKGRVERRGAALNHYFGAKAIRLPYTYGGNLALRERSPGMLEGMQADMMIAHYITSEPFNARMKCPGGICNQKEVSSLKE